MSVEKELDDLRLDIEVLRALIDAALDRGVRGDDPLLRAIASVLQERRHRLEQLSETTMPQQP
jgi:hypothetical protein